MHLSDVWYADMMSSLSGVTSFFTEVTVLRPIVLPHASAPTVTPSYLTTASVYFCFCFFHFFVWLEMLLSPSIFVPLPFLFVWRVLFKSLSRTVKCTRESIRMYMCYSQGDGPNTSLSRLS